MVERVAPGDAGGVDENESEKQKDVDSSSSGTTTEATTKTATDRPQMQVPRDFGSTSSGDSESGGTESSSTSEETATTQPTKGSTTDRPQMEAPSDEPNRFATSEGRTPEDKAPAPGGEPQMEARMDEPMRGPASRPGSESVDERQPTGGAPERVRPDSSREDLQAAAKEAKGQRREFEGISKAEEQRVVGTTSTSVEATDVESSDSDGGPGIGDSLWAASPAGAFAASTDIDLPDVGLVDSSTRKKASDASMFATLPGQTVAEAWSGVDETLREHGNPRDPQATSFERGFRDMIGDPGSGVRERGSGFRNILQENTPAGPASVQAGSQEIASDLASEIDPRQKGPIQQLPVTGGPPPGFSLFGPGKAIRGASGFVSAARGSKIASGSTRTGPTGYQVAESVGRQGQFAAKGVDNLIRNAGVATAASTIGVESFRQGEIDTPTTREEFAQEEVTAPEEPSGFKQGEIPAPEQSEGPQEELTPPEEVGTFSELDTPTDLGERPTDSVVINRDGDVSVILSAQQMFRDPKQDEDDILDIPDEFLPEDDVVIGEREDETNMFDQPRDTGNELAEQVEEQEVDWQQQQQRDTLSDESTQTDTLDDLAEDSVGDTFGDQQVSQSVSEPSVGTGTGVGGLLDEETKSEIGAQTDSGLDSLAGTLPDLTQPTLVKQDVRQEIRPELGDLFDTTPETARPTGNEFGNPTQQQTFDFGLGGPNGGSIGEPLGLPLTPESGTGGLDPSGDSLFEHQYEVDLPDAEDVLFGSDKKKKDDDFLGGVGDFGGGLDMGDLGEGFGGLDDF